jgi:hypothetical protein
MHMPTRARRGLFAAWLLTLVGCASAGCATAPTPPPQTPVAATSPAAVISPADRYRVELARAALIGRTLYLHDKASAIGTDAFLEHVAAGGATPVGGYLSLRDVDANGAAAPSFTVLFFTRDAEPRIAYRVHVPFQANAQAVVEDVSPPAAPAPAILTLIRARRTALAALPPTTQPINPVVLPARPALGEDGILVYLLAGTKRAGVAVLGLHHRVLVSPDGERVLRFEPLSKGPLEAPLRSPSVPAGAKPVGLVTSHSVTDYPLETHVFESLLYGMPLTLVGPHGTWEVDGDRIAYEGPAAAPLPPPACAPVCTAAAGRCPHGPPDQASCLTVCERVRSGPCADRYAALFACAGPAPVYACDAHGGLTVAHCEREYESMLRCFAHE